MPEIDPSHELSVYVEYLKIPHNLCPPNYYSLLAVPSTIGDATSIDKAAKKRSGELRQGLPVKLHPAGRKILKRIARARICLLDVDARAAYDASIGKQLRVDSANNTKAHAVPTAKLVPSNKRPTSNPNLALQPSTPVLLTPPQSSSPPSLKLPSKIDLPDLEEFDDLLSEIPDVEPPPSHLSRGVESKSKHRIPQLKKSSTSLPAVYTAIGAVVAIVVVVAAIFALSSEDVGNAIPQQVASADASIATDPNVEPEGKTATEQPSSGEPVQEGDKETPEESSLEKTKDSSPKASSIPILPLAKRGVIRHISPDREVTSDNLTSEPRSESSPLANSAQSEVTESEPPDPLLTEVTLPPLRGSESTLSTEVEAPFDLGPIGSIELSNLQLTLDQPSVEKESENIRFEINRSSNLDGQPAWEIKLRSVTKNSTDEKSVLDDVGAGLNELIAKIFIEDSRLKLIWVLSEHLALADQLRNCVLCLGSAPTSHRIALRPCTLVKPVLIDFNEKTQVIKLEQDPLPPLDSSFLKIVALENFGTVEQQPTDGIVPFKKTVKIRLSGWERPVEFRVKFGGSRSKPSVLISAHYKLDRKWQRMTIEEVDAGLIGVQRALRRSEADLSAGKAAQSSLPSRISSLYRQISSSSGGNTAALQGQQRVLKSQLTRANSMVRRANKSIPELRAKIPMLRNLASLGNRLHEKARIQFCVAVKTEKGILELLRTTDDVNNIDEEETSE